MAGAVLEQHPQRARLFMQWKEMVWPVMWDPFNLLELPVVPLTLLVDPEGTIQLIQPLSDNLDQIAEYFLADAGEISPPPPVDRPDLDPAPSTRAPAGEWSDHAVNLAMWGGPSALNDAVDAANRSTGGSEDPVLWFRSGVVHRMRYDSVNRRPGDFRDAVAAWSRALELDPNNYIWRRRLQQYGPRLAKPYPFYDWVPQAREEIVARGDTPVELPVEPGGAEFAEPSQEPVETEHPVSGQGDPDERVLVDEDGLIMIETLSIPTVTRPGESMRIHLSFEPDQRREAHWNNEAGLSELWVSPPTGWAVSPQQQSFEPGTEDVSDEVRRLELEVGVPADAEEGTHQVEGYALYYVCEGKTGVCLYRRQNITIPVLVDSAALPLS